MNTLTVLLVVLGIYLVAYRYYSAFLTARVLALSNARQTPAHTYRDGHNYVPTSKWVLFGHHFAAIAGAGPLVGPTLAAQFGFAPGLIWLVAGAVIAGAVQDFTVLVASARHKGRSLAEIARTEISPFAGLVAMIAVLFILLVTLAGLGIVVVNALAASPWGVFTIGMTIPIAIGMGLAMFRGSRLRVAAPSIAGVALLMSALVGGHFFAQSSWASALAFNAHQITLLLAAYGFIASTLPVWLLLTPRDYLSTYVKLGTIAALILGIFWVHPTIQFPAVTNFVHGGGPIIKGTLFPFLFVTIACGAISGFHSLVSSGTTSKMLDRECDARFIGYGAMLAESLVGVMALIAACSMAPGDYFAINSAPAVFARLGLHTVHLDAVSQAVGEHLAGRTGGAVSLAVGMAQIFQGIPGMQQLLGYWYHYAIMFEALFILTTVDAGTRVARYVLHELLGKIYSPLGNQKSIAAGIPIAALVVFAWGYLIYTGNISTIWPLFGTGNQLLATIALAVVSVFLVNMGRARYALLTAIPAAFVGITTITAGVLSIRNIFWPLTANPVTAVQGWLDSVLMTLFLAGVVLVAIDAIMRVLKTLRGEPLPAESCGPEQSPVKMRCC
ncbi:MAG TPA: carbon starvation protein A [Terracidiphilus sp.]|nr:carbon starvation protein A [Terracidiphilus sp.]